MALDDEERELRSPGESKHQQELARMLALSDGVFAIAITLLVLQLTVPEIASGAVAAELASRLMSAIPEIVTYCIGFSVIAMYWVGHRRTFLVIVRTDSVLTLLNLVVLLFIAFMPFPTAVLGKYGNTNVAVVFYAVTLAAAGAAMLALWLYAALGHRLISRDVGSRAILHHTLRAALPVIVFLLSIPVAQWSPKAAEYSWGLILVVRVVTRRVFRNDL